MFPVGFAVTVLRTQRDAFGDLVQTAEATVSDCGLLGHGSSENREGREQVTETATLAAPTGADIQATDEVLLPDGSRWQVDGRPWVPQSPLTGWQPATSVPMRRVTG